MIQIKVENALSPVEGLARVSTLVELPDEPFDHRLGFSVVKTLDLMRCNSVRALHLLKGRTNFFGKLYLLPHVKVVLELYVDVEVAAGDTPAHAPQNLVEGIDVEPCSEVASCHK